MPDWAVSFVNENTGSALIAVVLFFLNRDLRAHMKEEKSWRDIHEARFYDHIENHAPSGGSE